MSELKRRRGARSAVRFPDAQEALKRRREFLALLGKAVLGAGVLGTGLLRCDSGGGAMVMPDMIEDAADVVEDAHIWDSSGIAPPPPDTVDSVGPDLKDVVPDEIHIQGDLPRPPLPDTIQKDTCPYPEDVEGDGVPLPGEAPMPDTIEHEDVHEQEDSKKMDFSPAGFMPYPEE